MAITLVPQNDTGTAVGANCYIPLDYYKAYHDERGNTYSANDEVLKGAIIKAADHMDRRWKFKGVKLVPTQTTEFPRTGPSMGTYWTLDTGGALMSWWNVGASTITDSDGQPIVGIHWAIKEANAEYAHRIQAGTALLQDAPPPSGGRLIRRSSIKLDVLEKEVEYEPGQAAGFVMGAFPSADLIITQAGLVVSTSIPMR